MTNTTFKVGDRVKLNQEHAGRRPGEMGTVTKVERPDEFVAELLLVAMDDGEKNYDGYAYRWDLVSRFNVGDKVRFKPGVTGSQINLSNTMDMTRQYEVIELNPEECYGRFDLQIRNPETNGFIYSHSNLMELIPEGATMTDKTELDLFKEQVWREAQKAKRIHGWCGEIDSLLEGLGVSAPKAVDNFAPGAYKLPGYWVYAIKTGYASLDVWTGTTHHGAHDAKGSMTFEEMVTWLSTWGKPEELERMS